MLDGGEIINLMLMGHNNDTARVLSGGSLYAGTALRQPFHLTAAFVNPPLFKIFHHIAVGGLFRQGTDSPGTEGGTFPKDDLHIFVGLRLVFSGEVQVNIRLLVALESEECLERNIMPFL